MANDLTEDEIEEFREAFSAFDKDGDGEIDFDEFLTMVTTNIKHVRQIVSKVFFCQYYHIFRFLTN